MVEREAICKMRLQIRGWLAWFEGLLVAICTNSTCSTLVCFPHFPADVTRDVLSLASTTFTTTTFTPRFVQLVCVVEQSDRVAK